MLKSNLSPSSRHVLLTVIIIICLCVIICLVIISPLALIELGHFKKNWSQLSNIGQTYGAVSALLSSLALAGVVVSLLFQARSNQTAREETTRTLHQDLMKMAMDDPKLMTALGAPWGLPIPTESAAVREFLYIRMWTTFLAGNFAIGEITESEVHYIAANEILKSQAGRDYWIAVGAAQVKFGTGRRRQFYRILDEEYRKLVAGNVPTAEPIKESAPFEARPNHETRTPKFMRQSQVERVGIAVSAAIIGAIVERAWQRNSSLIKRQRHFGK